MKTIFDKENTNELLLRIELLNENSERHWGKMNVQQMLKHCILCDEMYLGKKVYKRSLLGFILGGIALSQLMKDEKPKKRNSPTKSDFKNLETFGNFLEEKTKWIETIKEYEHFNNPNFIHWFYGKMSKEQIGISVYKHIDHHLRQFGC